MSSWYNKNDQEITHRLIITLESENLNFIGRFISVEDKDFGFFKDVRSLSGVRKYYPTNDGEQDDLSIRPLEVWSKKTILFNSGKRKIVLEDGKWYKFYVLPAQKQLRLKNENPFLLQTDLSRAVDINLFNGSELIENIQKDSINTPESVKGKLTRSIEAISNEINTQPATFIFELIQNADDYPNDEKYVKISFDIRSPYLIIKHNGSKFDVNNAVAICDINEGDKRSEVEKIGFKGIGFKSIFKDCSLAYLKSGEYSFRFDELKWRNEGRKLFWQITPINTEEEEYHNVLMPYTNVNLVIKPRESKQLDNYKLTLLEHFKDERILLFLRNVKEIDFILNEDSFSISNNSNKWKILKSKNILVDETVRDELNRGIALNDKRIPLKYQGIEMTEIGFGFLINENKVQSLDDATIYAYLPTKVNLGFGFLLNGNFIPDGSRTHLHQDLKWNEFLFEKSGELLLFKLVELIERSINIFSVINLIPNFNKLLDVNDDEKIQFINAFKKGFDKNIKTKKFIPAKTGSLESLQNILIDETGLAELLGEEFFQLTGISEKLIDKSGVGEGIDKIKELINQNNVGLIYNVDRLKNDIKTKLQEWLKLPSNNFKFIEHLNSDDSLKSLLKSEEIVLSNNGDLFKVSNLYDEVPKEISFLLPKKLNNEVSILLKDKSIKLEFKKFEPIQFFLENIIANTDTINENFENETNILLFWQFVFNNWQEIESEKAIIDYLKKTYLLCKPDNINQLSKCLVSNVFLSAEYNLSNEIESTVREIIQDAQFISEKYISKKGDEVKWRKIFIQLGCVGDLQKAIAELLPNLSSIQENQHFLITKQIFKYWRDNQDKETRLNIGQIELIKTSLKLKCVDNIYRITSECIISDHYQTNKTIDSILKEIYLPNQISSEYSITQISEWNTFLKEIGSNPLEEKQHVLDAKLTYIVSNQDELQESHHEYIKEIFNLYNARNSNGLDFDFLNTLSNIKLKTVDNEFNFPFDIHLSSVYKPKLNIENDKDLGQIFNFLSKDYYSNNIPTKFFLRMGVNENFKLKPTIERIHIDKFKDTSYLQIFLSMKTYLERYNVIVRNYTQQQIRNVTSIRNHINLNYNFVFTNPKYLPDFWEFILNDNYVLKKLAIRTELRIWDNNIYSNDNYILYNIKSNKTILSNGLYKRPSELFSQKLIKYLDTDEYSDIDFSSVFIDDDKLISLEELIGIKQELSANHIISFLSKDSIALTEQELKDLNIVEILKKSNLNPEEIKNVKLPNKLFEWKQINELFISNDSKMEIKSEQHIHEIFLDLANDFGVKELSDDSIELKTIPEYPSIKDEIQSFFKERAKFIAFKIDQKRWEEIELNIIELLSSFKFYEVEFVAKVFPKDEPIYQEILDFYCDEEKREVFYKGIWKTNKKIIEFLHNQIKSDKLETVWFDNIINRWDNEKIIATLVDMFDNLPSDWLSEISIIEEDNSTSDAIEKDDFWSKLTENDAEFIRGIIVGDYEMNEQLDANIAAKIKTLMMIKDNYSHNEIFDDEYHLKAGDDEIIVRSAQRGLLYLNLHHWEKLDNSNTKIAIYTNNEIKIFDSKSDLFDFAKPQNRFGVLKLPNDYTLNDYNSLNNIKDKGKWHYVFIVNENTKAAQSYKEVMNLDDYNF